MEIKRDFFLILTWLMSNIIKDYLDWYICWPKTLKLKSSTFYMYYSQIFTDQTARNFLE